MNQKYVISPDTDIEIHVFHKIYEVYYTPKWTILKVTSWTGGVCLIIDIVQITSIVNMIV
jgi:hypothetical protein